METLRIYAITVITGALICGILLRMVHGGSMEALLRLVSGIFLMTVLIYPLSGKLNLTQYHSAFYSTETYEQPTVLGEKMAQQETSAIIRRQLEAYILDKGGQAAAGLKVRVILDGNYLPVRAELYGPVTDSVRQELSEIIAKDLGISKENQLWTG